jgi:hypothetical protein
MSFIYIYKRLKYKLFRLINSSEVIFAIHLGYMVIIPDYYRGTICDVTKEEVETIMAFLRNESAWEGKLKDDWEKSICPYATKNGAKSFGTIGKPHL